MSDDISIGGRRRRRRQRESRSSAPYSRAEHFQALRVWKCPNCGRTRPGAVAGGRAPHCRNDLAEMRIALVASAPRPATLFGRRGGR